MPDDPTHPIAIVGNLNVDQIVATVTRFPKWDEELIVQSSHLEVAGTAGYLALAARGLGMTPFVVSTVGDDANARFLRQELVLAGIADAGVETIAGSSTGLGIIFVGAQGQRSILTVLGAHEQMDVEVARRHDREIAACPEVFLCGNYLLPKFSPGHVTDYARSLRARGQYVVFDPSWDPEGWPQQTREETLALLEQVDLFLPNEEELCHLMDTTSWQEAVAGIGSRVSHIVVKRGAQGAVSVVNGEVVEVPALPIDAVNTIGAGDVFDMHFLYARRKGWDVQRCLEFACAAAASVVVQTGTRRYPGEADVWTFLATVREGVA